MKNQSPYQTQDQLQVPIHYGLTVCNTETERRVTQSLAKCIGVNKFNHQRASVSIKLEQILLSFSTRRCNMLQTMPQMFTKQWSACICTAHVKHSDLMLAWLQIQSVDDNQRRHLWIKPSRCLARTIPFEDYLRTIFIWYLREPDEVW